MFPLACHAEHEFSENANPLPTLELPKIRSSQLEASACDHDKRIEDQQIHDFTWIHVSKSSFIQRTFQDPIDWRYRFHI